MPKIATFDIKLCFSGQIKELKGTVWGYYADPFILANDDTKILLVAEYYSRLKRKGDIYLMALDKALMKWRVSRLISDRKHRSYPFVYKKNDDFYIFTESISTKSMEVYSLNGKMSCYLVCSLPGFYVDPTLINRPDGLHLIYYTGFSNIDGVCMDQPIEFDGQKIRCVGNPTVIGYNRPAGLIGGELVFQARNLSYGWGLEKNKLNASQLKIIADLQIFGFDTETSHHVHTVNGAMTWDQARIISI